MTINLKEPHFEAEDIQSIIYLGYKDLKSSAYLLCSFKVGFIPYVKKWIEVNLKNIQTLGKDLDDWALNIAFTKGGLAKLGLDKEELETFSISFVEGMAARQNTLGDYGQNDPGNWSWGNEAENEAIDMILLVFAQDSVKLEQRIKDLKLNPDFIRLNVKLDSSLMDKEHFGFKDGITDLTTEGFLNHYIKRNAHKVNNDRAKFWEIHGDDVLKDGEILLGYKNEYGELTSGPKVKKRYSILPENLNSNQDLFQGDFGKNGSYLVFRQLEQDVHSFWKFMGQQVEAINISGYDAIYIASKMMGRYPDGRSFISNDENIDGFASYDPDGLKCPFASHVRRCNPRDALINDNIAKSKEAVRKHRIIRRGRSYGKMLSDASDMQQFVVDAVEALPENNDKRGLNFICFNADISQQFEFIQQNWINNPKFTGLYNDPDPIASTLPQIGKSFSIPDQPFRKRLEMQQNFVTVVGGSYFFMPGLNAVRYLVYNNSIESTMSDGGKSFIDIGLSIY